jgi:hypothetical protein
MIQTPGESIVRQHVHHWKKYFEIKINFGKVKSFQKSCEISTCLQ